ncbi:MAG: tail fiber domain-containing protein [Pseudobdellovibrionaceae bacterium]
MTKLTKKNPKNNSGFGILEVLAGSAIGFITMLGTITLVNTLNKANLNNQQQTESTFLHNDIYSLLRDPQACQNTFSTLAANNAGQSRVNVSSLKKADNSIVFSSGTLWANKLKINQMSFGDFVADNPVAPDSGKGWLRISIAKPGPSLGPQFLDRDVKIQIMRDPGTKKVLNCVAIGGTKDIWLLNPDGSIFYNGGNVGIGTTSPAVSLQQVSDQPGAGFARGIMSTTYSNSNRPGSFAATRARGSMNTPSQSLANDTVGYFYGAGWAGNTGFAIPAFPTGMMIEATEDWSSSAATGGRINFITIANGTSSGLSRMVINEDGNVGIGTTTPSSKLVVTSTNGGYLRVSPDDGGLELGSGNDVSSYIDFHGNGNLNADYRGRVEYDDGLGMKLLVNGNPVSSIFINETTGAVGIGTEAPWRKLDIGGGLNVGPAGGSNAIYINQVSICNNTGCTSPSDKRLKEQVQNIENPFENLLRLQGVTYYFKDKKKYTKQRQIGLIAQDVEKVYPEVVSTDSETGIKSINYGFLVSPLIEAVKKLYSDLTNHTKELDELKKKMAALEEKNNVNKCDEKIEKLLQKNLELSKKLIELETLVKKNK